MRGPAIESSEFAAAVLPRLDLLIAPLRLVGATGSPVRMFALWETGECVV